MIIPDETGILLLKATIEAKCEWYSRGKPKDYKHSKTYMYNIASLIEWYMKKQPHLKPIEARDCVHFLIALFTDLE